MPWEPARVGLMLAFATGCKAAPCDDVELRAAATAFEDRSQAGRRDGLAKLAEACRELPMMLARNLEASYGEMPDDAYRVVRDRMRDPVYNAYYHRTCPASVYKRAAALQGRREFERDHALREVCDFDRLEVLAPDEPFIRDDFDALMLFVWLLDQRVEPALARRIARGLVSAGASEEQRERDCFEGRGTCDALNALRRIRGPLSTFRGAHPTGTRVTIGPRGITVDGRPLEAGFPGGTPAPVLIYADRETPVSTVIDTVSRAREAGHDAFALQFAAGALPVGFAPIREPPPEHPPPRLEVGKDGVRVYFEDPTKAVSGDEASIGTWLTRAKGMFPEAQTVVFVVDPDVTLQRLVEWLDVARGEQCPFVGSDPDDVPAECLFWRPVIEARSGPHSP